MDNIGNNHMASNDLASWLENEDLSIYDDEGSDFFPKEHRSLLNMECLRGTLRRRFGFEEFRPGQAEAATAIISGRDVAVFWATGKGKSLCYQLPALHCTKGVAIVVSPLISLMQDQVVKLNATVGEGVRTIAIAITSHDHDPAKENAAWRGEIPLIYVSPERLLSPGFLDKIVRLEHLTLFAIDEAHCILQWGNDAFRKDYMSLSTLRQHSILRRVPIMAITATANASQRQEIIHRLGMHNPLMCLGSADRDNLMLSVRSKSTHGNLAFLIQALCTKPVPTIVYTMTRKEVDNVIAILSAQLPHVAGYHAGMSAMERRRVHLAFLNDSITVVVATVAFGMGIDKPNIRQVVHLGPPKSIEEYYQQIGRAGRDGVVSTCTLICNDHDFIKYQSDFYTQGLSDADRQSYENGLKAIREYTRNQSSCRRKWLIEYFGETTDHLTTCIHCDNCTYHAAAASLSSSSSSSIGIDYLERDYSTECRALLRLVESLPGRSITKLLPHLEKTVNASLVKELVVPMLQAQILHSHDKQMTYSDIHGRKIKRTFQVLSISAKGLQLLQDPSCPVIRVAVPRSVREKEEIQRLKSEEVLTSESIDMSLIPLEERQRGRGPTLDSFLQFDAVLRGYRSHQKPHMAEPMEICLQEIIKWRAKTAEALGIAPTHVLSDAMARRLILAKVDQVDAIRALGVRIAHADDLCAILVSYKAKALRYVMDEAAAAIKQPRGEVIQWPLQWPAKAPWKHAHSNTTTSRSNSGTAWSLSYFRFQQGGEHLQKIATDGHKNGRSIQTLTVLGHLMTAAKHGKILDVRRAMKEGGAPEVTLTEWEAMRHACDAALIDVADSKAVSAKEILCGILGREEVWSDEKSESQRQLESLWYSKIRLYVDVVQAGFGHVEEMMMAGKDGPEPPKAKRTRIS